MCRLFSYFLLLNNIFSAHNSWWIYPVVGQLIGGALGGLVYELTIAIHHDIDEEDSMAENHPGDIEAREARADGEGAGSKDTSPRTKQ